MRTVHAPVPVQSPLQPAKVELIADLIEASFAPSGDQATSCTSQLPVAEVLLDAERLVRPGGRS
jgi:hypothetical protein